MTGRTSSWVTDRPVAVTMACLAAVVFGVFSYERLPLTLMPELSYPTLTVRTEVPGAAPEEIENDVSRPLEEALGVIGGLRRISSINRAGLSDVVLELSWTTNISDAIQEVIEKVDLVELPDEATRPRLLRFDPSLDPIMELSLIGRGDRFQGEAGLRRLRHIAEHDVRRLLEPVPGVAALRVRGGLEEEIQVLLDPERLERAGISITAVTGRLAAENLNVAGGTVKEGRTEYMVRTLNEFTDLDQIRRLVVGRSIETGQPLRIEQVGSVRIAQRDQELVTHAGGGITVQLDVYKEADANIVALSKRIRRVLEGGPRLGRPRQGRRGGGGLIQGLRRDEGVELSVVADRSRFIEQAIGEVRNTAIIGGLLAVALLYLFLGAPRPTLIVGLSIPLSMVMTFAAMSLLDVSLNIMSLGGLALGVGMLVDSSIVVLESIQRCREEGDGVRAAALRGTAEVRRAVIASTLTSVAVFLPMVFLEGMAGQAFTDLGLAVCASLGASLVVALVLIPMLASRPGLAVGHGESAPRRPRLVAFTALAGARRDGQALLAWRSHGLGIGRLLRSVVTALALLAYLLPRTVATLAADLLLTTLRLILTGVAGSVILVTRRLLPLLRPLSRRLVGTFTGLIDRLTRAYPALLRPALARPGLVALITAAALALTIHLFSAAGRELLPQVHQGEFTAVASLPVGTPLEVTTRRLAPVEERLLADPHIEQLVVSYGSDPATAAGVDEGENTARFKVILRDSTAATEEEVLARVRQAFEEIPDVTLRITRPVLFSFRTPIEVEVHGDDLVELRRKSHEVAEVLAGMPQLTDVEPTMRVGAPEVRITYDRDQLVRRNLDVAQVAEIVRQGIKGAEATRFNGGDRRIPIVVRFDRTRRMSLEEIRNVTVNPGRQPPVRLGAVARVELAEGPSEVRRVDGKRVGLVRANLAGASLGEAVAAIDRVLRDRVSWPPDMTFLQSGQAEEWTRSQSNLWVVLALSVFLVYVIMASQFESMAQPLVIMLTIPLALLGSLLALIAFEINLSVVVFLGMIMLSGIVVNNAIVLVDYANQLRARGHSAREAVVEAGRIRLRPILMTTATTVLGLVPMALGGGAGAELRQPIAVTVIAGLLLSTLLTLVVIPSGYALLASVTARLDGGTGRSDEGTS